MSKPDKKKLKKAKHDSTFAVEPPVDYMEWFNETNADTNALIEVKRGFFDCFWEKFD